VYLREFDCFGILQSSEAKGLSCLAWLILVSWVVLEKLRNLLAYVIS